jgi:hypothetical protein
VSVVCPCVCVCVCARVVCAETCFSVDALDDCLGNIGNLDGLVERGHVSTHSWAVKSCTEQSELGDPCRMLDEQRVDVSMAQVIRS